jgi:hypothetical protein
VLVPLVAVLATLGMLECALALFHPIGFSVERNMYYEADPYTGYRMAPHSRGNFGPGIPAFVNANGHRDVATPVARRPGVARILVLGDSFTAGSDVRQEEAYPKVLERLLNARPGGPVEVVNTGVGGWDPFMYAQYYLHDGWRFRPDLVLVGFFVGNDTYDQSTRVDQLPTALLGRRVSRNAAALGPVATAAVYLTEHTNLGRLLLQRAPILMTPARSRCDDFSEVFLTIQRARLVNHLRRDEHQVALARNALTQMERIKRRLDADGVPLVVAFLPDENQINTALQRLLVPVEQRDVYDFAMPQSMLAETFAAAGIRTIDLLPAFRADPRCLYNNDTHWTPEGHALAARVIAEAIDVPR